MAPNQSVSAKYYHGWQAREDLNIAACGKIKEREARQTCSSVVDRKSGKTF